MLKKILSGISAGVCICLGGAVFLACENRIAGAILFSVALLCICMKGYALFTGKVGYIPEAHDKDAVSLLLLALLLLPVLLPSAQARLRLLLRSQPEP